MKPRRSTVSKTPGKFRVGDSVRIPRGWDGALGLIVEDFGPGYDGRPRYLVKVHIEDEPELSLSEDDLEPVET